MDVFRLLCKGTSLNLKNNDLPKDIFTCSSKDCEKSSLSTDLLKDVENELDFFHQKKKKTSILLSQETKSNDENTNKKILTISSEIEAKKFRKSIKSKVTGTDIPFPIISFEDLNLRYGINPKILANLSDLGFRELTSIQNESIPIILENRDLISCAPTGSGKTLAFLLPIVEIILKTKIERNSGIFSLIITPTNELAQQIFYHLQLLTKGIKLTVDVLSKNLAQKISDGVIDFKKYKIIISTPLRLVDLLKKKKINLSTVQNITIDETDKLFEKGFSSQVDEILLACTKNNLRKYVFSATITSGVEEMALSIMVDSVKVVIGLKEAACSSINQRLLFTGDEKGKLVAIKQLLHDGDLKPFVIIFLQSIFRANALYHELAYENIRVDVIHSDQTFKQRNDVIQKFKNGEIWILISTDILSRGIDFKGVNLIINYDIPQSSQEYIHRIGRTGRNGNKGNSITFFTKEDVDIMKPIINVMNQSGCHDAVSKWMNNLSNLSKNKKRQLKKKQISRKQISTVLKIKKKGKSKNHS